MTRLLCPLVTILMLAACAETPPRIGSFGDFTPPTSQPHYLACPQNYCLTAPDELTPLIAVPADRLRAIVRRAIEAQPQAALISSADEGLRLVYRQALTTGTAFVTVEIVDADDGASGVAIYSQSATGDRASDRDVVRYLFDAIARGAGSVLPFALSDGKPGGTVLSVTRTPLEPPP
jgi:hypothetical protein